ncbi:hypothetical protein C2845_PM04G22430 [Panicum miliaceum]|uniref:Uncharacterized protein n=1 Tax=Panicum miliaceum TaxID=4540 RepID=A0A3L6QPL7_PANMI|nr:hypothetical protein C2845_PM04G22430 [Panicum miliaceum]
MAATLTSTATRNAVTPLPAGLPSPPARRMAPLRGPALRRQAHRPHPAVLAAAPPRCQSSPPPAGLPPLRPSSTAARHGHRQLLHSSPSPDLKAAPCCSSPASSPHPSSLICRAPPSPSSWRVCPSPSMDPTTAKTLQNKGRIDCTRGVSREQRAIDRRNKLESLLSRGGDGPKRLSDRKTRFRHLAEKIRKYEVCRVLVENLEKNECAIEEERFGEVLYDGEVPTFVEKSFGYRVGPGDKMIFACSGIPLPRGTARLHLTRFVTSAHLVREFKRYGNRDDKLRVAVRLSDKKTTDGFLGLYDDDIAIVTCLSLLDVYPIDLNFKATPATSASPDDSVLAAGRAYMVPSLMAMHGSPCRVCVNAWIPEHQHMNKAVLGGPLLQQNDARFLGMIYEFYDHGDTIVRYCFLPLELLRERLEHFGILNPKQLDFSEYKLPEGVSSIVPSGFMKIINRIKAWGYPMPPSLVLEWNVRSFVCTGLLIKWHGSKAMRTVILTSASLIRDHDNQGVIDKTLTIEVFLPPNQRGSGTLEFYNLSYNIAIVSVKKNFNAVRKEDIFSKTAQKPSEKVVAIGRDAQYGPLMATIGEVKHTNKGSKVVCKAYIRKKILDDRWPVAKLYWYHGDLDVSRYHVPKLIGKQLH